LVEIVPGGVLNKKSRRWYNTERQHGSA